MYSKSEIKSLIGSLTEDVLRRPVQGAGLNGGRTGLALTYFTLSRFDNNKDLAAKGLSLLFDLFERTRIESLDFVSGTIGLTSTISCLVADKLLDFDLSSFKTVDRSIYEWANKCIEVNNLDFFYGPIGALNYFLCRLPDDSVHEYIEKIIKSIERSLVNYKSGQLALNEFYIKADKRPEKEINFGIAHGMSSLLIMLIRLHACGFKSSVQQLVDSFLLINAGYTKPHPYAFITSVNINSGEPLFQNRLGWCFSDLNILHFLLLGSAVFKRSDWKDFAMSKANTVIERTSISDTLADEPFFCHGFAGISYYYLYLYELTQEKAFLDAHQHWTNKTLLFFSSINGSYFESEEFIKKHNVSSFFSGLPGVILSLISSHELKCMPWSQLTLL